MANPMIRVADVDKELACAICIGRLNVPKSLNCLHTFCVKCLDKVIIDAKITNEAVEATFICPVCREPHPIPTSGKAEDLKTNFTVANLVEQLRLAEGEKNVIKCTNTDDGNPAVQYCGECQAYLCQGCFEMHGKVKGTRNHSVAPMDEIRNNPEKIVHKRYCQEPDHDEELKIYCLDTEEAICRDCELDDGHRDKGHTHKLIRTVIQELREELKDRMNDVQKKHKTYRNHATYIDEIMKQSDQSIDMCHDNVKRFFDAQRRKLDSFETDLRRGVHEHKEQADKQMSTELEVVQIAVAKLETANNYTQKLLDSGTAVDIALMSKQTKQRLDHLGNEAEWNRKSVQAAQWIFLGNEENPLKSVIRGGINPSEIIVKDLTQPVKGKNQFLVMLDEGVNSNAEPVVTVTRNDERIEGVVVTKETVGRWIVSYHIPGEGEYKIGVSLEGVEAEGSPFRRIWRNKLTKGTMVDRGRDWKWGDQNGGPGNRGAVLGWSGEVGASENWVKVKWKNGRHNNYRWGAEEAYDLMILSMPGLEFHVEEPTNAD